MKSQLATARAETAASDNRLETRLFADRNATKASASYLNTAHILLSHYAEKSVDLELAVNAKDERISELATKLESA